MKKRKELLLVALVGLLACCLATYEQVVTADDYVTIAPTNQTIRDAFEGPFFYTDDTTTSYTYLTSNSDTTWGNKTIEKVETVTEKQTITYFLHVPDDYLTSNKTYPVVVFTAGDGICVYNNFNDGNVVDFSGYTKASPYYYFANSYKNNNVCGTAYKDTWGNKFIDSNGNYLTSNVASCLPHYYANGNADGKFVYDWFNLTFNTTKANKEKYDCFFIYFQPTDRVWYENINNTNILSIRNQFQEETVYEANEEYENIKYSNGSMAYAGSNTVYTYDATYLSEDSNSQLLSRTIDNLAKKYPIDLSRQYLAGFSLGAQFSYDAVCHNPNRYACVLTSGLPTLDMSDDNCENWKNVNCWFFNGTGDYCNPNGVMTSQFVSKLDGLKETSGGTGTAKYTICSGGHNGGYMGGTVASASGSTVDTTSKTETFDFMFNSQRTDGVANKAENNRTSVESIKVSAKASSTVNADGSYDLVLVSGAPLGDYNERGFIVTKIDGSNRTTKTIPVTGMVKESKETLGSNNVTFKATDYNSAYLYTYKISNIPASVTCFSVKSYAMSNTGTYYSDEITINVTISGGSVNVEVA